jgi:hypothetical protein
MEKHEPEKRQKYAPESNPQKKTKNAMDVSTPSQNAYLGPMQNSKMHKEKLQREKG